MTSRWLTKRASGPMSNQQQTIAPPVTRAGNGDVV
jgi:hypothetical protein